MAHSRTPLVLYAPTYWQLPDLRPCVPISFKLPSGVNDAQIFLEGPARLCDPQGNPFGDPKGACGWISLPGDRPGLWKVEPLENRLVRARNFPPFFAMGDPECYFEPAIPWQREKPRPAAETVNTGGSLYVEGVTSAPGDQALYLGGAKTFSLEAGRPRDDDGSQFLPFRQGTVEFFFKPSWGTFDLPQGQVVKRLLCLVTGKSNWELSYRVDPRGTDILGGPRGPAHSFFGYLYVEGAKPYWLRTWLTQQLLERGEWVHVAYVWGLRPSYGPHGEKLSLMTIQFFVDGKGAKRTMPALAGANGSLPQGAPNSLLLGPLDGVVDELRVSDVQRYTQDFAPPSREKEWVVDGSTRALFHFNGSLEGSSCSTAERLTATVR
jgi:hypothetical protein